MKIQGIDSRVVALVGDLAGPLGPVPLERALRQHIELFQELRVAGASWPQIAALMTKHGLVRKDGKPIGPEQWASMISRIVRQAGGRRSNTISNVALGHAETIPIQPAPTETGVHAAESSSVVGKYADVRTRMLNAKKARDDL